VLHSVVQMNKEQKAQYAQFIEQRLTIDGFEDKAVNSLIKYYNVAKKGVVKDINRSIKKNLNHPSRARLTTLYKEIDTKIKVLTDKLTKPLAKSIGEAGAYSYKDTNRILSWEGHVKGYNNVARSATQIASMVQDEKLGGKCLDDWLWSALREENGSLKSEVAAAQIRGIGYKQLMKELPSRYNNMLSAKGNKQNIETVAKSYIQAANAKAHEDIYEANKNIIDKVEWSAIMENGNVSTGKGTCPRCAALDGSTYPSVSKGPSCPLHPRCRCMYLPITKSWKDMGYDIEELEPIYNKWYIRSPGRKILQKGTIDGNYADWWYTRSKKFQDNSMGPTRSELLRTRQIDFSDLVDKKGNLILLNDMDITTISIRPSLNVPYAYSTILDNSIFGEDGSVLFRSLTLGDCDE